VAVDEGLGAREMEPVLEAVAQWEELDAGAR